MKLPLKQVVITLVFALSMLAGSADAATIEDSVRLVEAYSNRSASLARAANAASSPELLKEQAAAKNMTVEELKNLSWSEEPGKRRFKKIRRIVKHYMLEDIEAIKQYGADASAAEKKTASNLTEELNKLSKEILQELDESFKVETEKKGQLKHREPPPVPSVDTPKLDPSPETGTRGIWDR